MKENETYIVVKLNKRNKTNKAEKSRVKQNLTKSIKKSQQVPNKIVSRQQEQTTNEIKSILYNLGHASKQGNMTSALLWLGQINASTCKKDPVGEADNTIEPLTLDSVKYIFHPTSSSSNNNTKDDLKRQHDKDQKQHSALYHAALHGYHDLVEYYLSLYLIYSLDIHLGTIHISQSFRSWFVQLNPTKNDKDKTTIHASIVSSSDASPPLPFFGINDYADQCVIDSSNKSIFNVMVKKRVNISHAMKVVDQASFSCAPYKHLIEPRMKEMYLDVKGATEEGRENIMPKEKVTKLDSCQVEGAGDDYDTSYDYDESDIILINEGKFQNNNRSEKKKSGDEYRIAADSESQSVFFCCIDDDVEVKGKDTRVQIPYTNLPSSIHLIRHCEDESDMVSIEVEMVDRKEIQQRGKLQKSSMFGVPVTLHGIDSDSSYSYSNYEDASTYFSFKSMISRGTWLPSYFWDALSSNWQQQWKTVPSEQTVTGSKGRLEEHMLKMQNENNYKVLLAKQKQQKTIAFQENDTISKGGPQVKVLKMQKETNRKVLKVIFSNEKVIQNGVSDAFTQGNNKHLDVMEKKNGKLRMVVGIKRK